MEKKFLLNLESRGTNSYGLQKFRVIAGTGKWLEIVGESCMGAFSQITSWDNQFQNASFIWSGKCEVSDKTLERMKNYKKSE